MAKSETPQADQVKELIAHCADDVRKWGSIGNASLLAVLGALAEAVESLEKQVAELQPAPRKAAPVAHHDAEKAKPEKKGK